MSLFRQFFSPPYDVSLLTSISAVFLSLAALIVSIYQTKIAREQQQMSVWPHLQADYIKTNDEFSCVLRNKGVGPAIIRSVRILYRGRRFDSYYQLAIRQLEEDTLHMARRDTVPMGFSFGSLGVGDVLKSDGEVTVGHVFGNSRMAGALVSVVRDTTYGLTIVYSDVYNNCWQLDGQETIALDKCPD